MTTCYHLNEVEIKKSSFYSIPEHQTIFQLQQIRTITRKYTLENTNRFCFLPSCGNVTIVLVPQLQFCQSFWRHTLANAFQRILEIGERYISQLINRKQEKLNSAIILYGIYFILSLCCFSTRHPNLPFSDWSTGDFSGHESFVLKRFVRGYTHF